ncbi:MAG: YeiH family protein [Clostridia bacterium]
MFEKKGKGILLCLGLGTIAYFAGKEIPLLGSSIFGILSGIIIGNIVKLPTSFKAGINYSGKKLLQYGIILLGASLNLVKIWEVGSQSFFVMLGTLLIALFSAFAFGKILGVEWNLQALIGAGTGICGGSAIAAVAPAIEAEDAEIAYAISVIFLYNVLAVLIFPFFGRLLGLSQMAFGLWAGTAINDTSSVVAAAYSYGDIAGDYATIVKLTRTTMIIPIALSFALYTAWKKKSSAETKYDVKKIIPWFVIWFLVAACLNSLGIISPDIGKSISSIGKFLIVVALTAIGLKTDIKQFKKAGFKPLLLGALVWGAVIFSSLLIQFLTGQL